MPHMEQWYTFISIYQILIFAHFEFTVYVLMNLLLFLYVQMTSLDEHDNDG
ncbi:hypothetical protein HanIR_Chr12g0564531 [Helianthus annuus]|nr:hypothetical protein HanIR_Chr12g0564531 [Helianthus annuus]